MDIFLFIINKWIWLGCAAIGFGILFNVPVRTLIPIFIMAIMGGSIKFLTIKLGGEIVLGSFLGATLIGFLSIIAAHLKHSPPFIFAIPAVIPMVPGVFAYRMMLGIMRMTDVGHAAFPGLLEETVSNGLNAFFVLLFLAVGVSAPMLLTRTESAKNFKLTIHAKQKHKK